MTIFNAITGLHPARGIGAHRIAQLLANGRHVQPGLDGDFTGRPMTRLIVDDELVLKMRSELRYRAGDDERWIARAVEAERLLGLHHPAKTWLILEEEDSGERTIANVAPRLAPLDQWLPSASPEAGIAVLERLLHIYTVAFGRDERQLDPGLSNFGTDADESLFYLDDESAPPRGLVSLAAAIASWVRVLPWVERAAGARIGAGLRRDLLEVFADPHPAVVVSEQLRAAFCADDRQVEAIDGMVSELVPRAGSRDAIGPDARDDDRPQRYLVLLADIHGNHAALDRALAHVDGLPGAEIWVLGDIVGYGPEPAACIERLRQRRDTRVIKGNHDHAVALGETGRGLRGLSPTARRIIDWTATVLSADDRSWLMELPAFHAEEDWLAVHGAPQDPTYFNGYVYHMTFENNLENLRARGISVCLHGHTHMAGAYRRKGTEDEGLLQGPFDLAEADHWLICPGSVGQPRGGFPGCELAVIDRERRVVDPVRLDYDIDSVITAIHEAGLPSHLGDRLLTGR